MYLSWSEYSLQLKKPFGITGNTRTTTPVVFVAVKHGDQIGIGEASLPPYLQETQQSVISFLEKLDCSKLDIENLQVSFSYLHSTPGNNAAKAAVEIALLDLYGKINSTPAYSVFNYVSDTPENTYTIGIGGLNEIEEKLQDASLFNVIKVKLGSSNDKAIIEEIRKHTSRHLCVDVNQGWRSKEEALDMINWLAERDVFLIEQPLRKDDLEGHKWIHERSPLPIFADESFQSVDDLELIKPAFAGINIKLMKCGGPSRAVEIMRRAKEAGLKILLGSMNESSCANLAAAHISANADYTDLDGPFLITNNPFKDPDMEDGRVILSNNPGLGLELNNGFINFHERFKEWR